MSAEVARAVLATPCAYYGAPDDEKHRALRAQHMRHREQAQEVLQTEYYHNSVKAQRERTESTPMFRHGEKRTHGVQGMTPRTRTRESRRSHRQATTSARSTARGDSGDSDPARPCWSGYGLCSADELVSWYTRKRIPRRSTEGRTR